MGLSAAGLIAPSLLSAAEQNHSDPTRVPGRTPSPYGSRASTETAQRLTTATHSLTPHQVLHGIITPSALHFERHHNGVPMIDPDQHRLLIHGLVERPLTFSMNDLMRFPSVTRTLFIECSGNSGKEWNGPTGKTVQDTHGLMSTSEWTGVPLSTVLAEAGIKPDAAWVMAEGSDAAAIETMKAKVASNMTDCARIIENEYLTGPWVMGDQYTVADPYLHIITLWMEGDGVDLSKFPKLSAHKAAMAQRPAVKKVLSKLS